MKANANPVACYGVSEQFNKNALFSLHVEDSPPHLLRGIFNCLTCGLGTSGRCSPCGGGTSRQASKKLAAQLQAMGGFCPILKCAQDRKVGFCLRDCNAFPCEHFTSGPYPFSQGFLEMQARRRKGGPPSPTG